MKTVFRKIISFLFLLIGFSPVLIVLILSLFQYPIKHLMKEKLETEKLQIISIKNNDIKWANPGKEILVDGKMFDIKTFKEKDGFTIFKGLFDDDETILKQKLKKNSEKNQEHQTQLLTQLFQTLQSIYNNHIEFSSFDLLKPLFEGSLCSENILSQFQEIPTPPPLI